MLIEGSSLIPFDCHATIDQCRTLWHTGRGRGGGGERRGRERREGKEKEEGGGRGERGEMERVREGKRRERGRRERPIYIHMVDHYYLTADDGSVSVR